MSAPGSPPPYPSQPPFVPAPPKRANPWKWLVLGCGGLIALSVCGFLAVSLGLFAAVTGKPTATPFIVAGGSGGTSVPASASGQGQTVKVKNWDVTVTGVERPGTELVWSQYNNKSTAAGTWVIVAVKMKNTGTQNFGVNNSDFEMRASGGTKYNVSSDGGSYSYSKFKNGGQIGGQVPPGVEVTYYIVFDVAPTATELQFVFKQDKNPIFTIGNATP